MNNIQHSNLTYFDFIKFVAHSVSFIVSDKDWWQLLLHCRLCHTSVYLKIKATGGAGGAMYQSVVPITYRHIMFMQLCIWELILGFPVLQDF